MTVKELSEVKTSTAAVSVFKSCYNNMLLTINPVTWKYFMFQRMIDFKRNLYKDSFAGGEGWKHPEAKVCGSMECC